MCFCVLTEFCEMMFVHAANSPIVTLRPCGVQNRIFYIPVCCFIDTTCNNNGASLPAFSTSVSFCQFSQKRKCTHTCGCKWPRFEKCPWSWQIVENDPGKQLEMSGLCKPFCSRIPQNGELHSHSSTYCSNCKWFKRHNPGATGSTIECLEVMFLPLFVPNLSIKWRHGLFRAFLHRPSLARQGQKQGQRQIQAPFLKTQTTTNTSSPSCLSALTKPSQTRT